MKFKLGVRDAGVKVYLEAKKEVLPKAMRMFAVEFYRQATISTPVDTGRARYGWNCSIGSPNFSIPAAAPDGYAGQSSGGTAFYQIDAERAEKAFTMSAMGDGKLTVYVANAVPYIGSLNNGHSRQAPARFVELAFLNAAEKLKEWLKNH